MEAREKTQNEVGLERAIQAKSQLETLVRSKEWGMVVAFIEDQSKRRINDVMTRHRPEADEANPSQDYVRGEWNGLNLVKKFIEDEIGIAREAVELYKQAVNQQGDD